MQQQQRQQHSTDTFIGTTKPSDRHIHGQCVTHTSSYHPLCTECSNKCEFRQTFSQSGFNTLPTGNMAVKLSKECAFFKSMIMLNTQLGVLMTLSPLVRVSMQGDMVGHVLFECRTQLQDNTVIRDQLQGQDHSQCSN